LIRVQAGEHRDCEQPGRRAGDRFGSGREHGRPAAGMHREQRRLQRQNGANCTGNRIRDVMKFEIEKYSIPFADQVSDERWPTG
jgi:hypothetical protein